MKVRLYEVTVQIDVTVKLKLRAFNDLDAKVQAKDRIKTGKVSITPKDPDVHYLSIIQTEEIK